MLIEILFFSLIGIVVGILLGLLPGFHLNNLVPLVFLLLPIVTSPHYLAVLIVSIAIAQVFTSFIPSVYLGAPDGDSNALSILPGHRLLLEGRGYEAIQLTVVGGFGALILSILFVLFFGNYFVSLYNIIRPYIAYPLIAVVLFMIFSEKQIKKILSASLVVILSGILGILVLNSSIVSQQNVLFPTFAGLFSISILITSITEKTKIPKQKIDKELKISKFNIIKSMVLGVIAGVLVGLLPAVGVSQAATFMQYLGGLNEARTFLVTLSGINTANEVISLNSLYLISNPRSGASVAIERILSEISFDEVLLFLGVIFLTSGIVVPITLFLGRTIPKFLDKINYTILSILVIIFLEILIVLMTGIYGLLIGLTATGIGLLCTYTGVRRSNCMGILLLPSIFFFTGLNPLILTLLNI
ncbi:MAG: tripartite tricarboxylate transporter permease [Candidatus Aenigmarchaeota archaeon]|nr:tripartite tricarboxylate transporter permease [Candidatus Aenigmarchaeota archaeon]